MPFFLLRAATGGKLFPHLPSGPHCSCRQDKRLLSWCRVSRAVGVPSGIDSSRGWHLALQPPAFLLCIQSTQQKLGKRQLPTCRAGGCCCWALGVAEEARRGLYSFSTGQQRCVGALCRPFRSSPSSSCQQQCLQGTGLVPGHWILHVLFHPTFPS